LVFYDKLVQRVEGWRKKKTHIMILMGNILRAQSLIGFCPLAEVPNNLIMNNQSKLIADLDAEDENKRGR
jgi:hypothetical protein